MATRKHRRRPEGCWPSDRRSRWTSEPSWPASIASSLERRSASTRRVPARQRASTTWFAPARPSTATWILRRLPAISASCALTSGWRDMSTTIKDVADAIKKEAHVKRHVISSRPHYVGGATIHAPEVRNAETLYIFAHECGHAAFRHRTGRGWSRLSLAWLHEYQAGALAQDALQRHGVKVSKARIKHAKANVRGTQCGLGFPTGARADRNRGCEIGPAPASPQSGESGGPRTNPVIVIDSPEQSSFFDTWIAAVKLRRSNHVILVGLALIGLSTTDFPCWIETRDKIGVSGCPLRRRARCELSVGCPSGSDRGS